MGDGEEAGVDLDHALAQALAQYSMLRRHINRGITRDVIGAPVYGGREALQWIDKLERPNVTALAEVLGVTRGGASKAVARLQSMGLVERYQLPDNRKEVYYRLSENGRVRKEQLERSLEALSEQELCYIRTLTSLQKQEALDFFNGFMAHLRTSYPPACPEQEEGPCGKP